MQSRQSSAAVDCFLNHDAILEFLGDNLLGIGIALATAAIGFILTRAAGAIIGEYAKEAYFTRFKNERRKLKAEVDQLATHNRDLQGDVECAQKVLAELTAENERLLKRAIQAEQLLRQSGQ